MVNWLWLIDIWLSLVNICEKLTFVTPSMLYSWMTERGKLSLGYRVPFLTIFRAKWWQGEIKRDKRTILFIYLL